MLIIGRTSNVCNSGKHKNSQRMDLFLKYKTSSCDDDEVNEFEREESDLRSGIQSPVSCQLDDARITD